jgi:hypothetical protein
MPQRCWLFIGRTGLLYKSEEKEQALFFTRYQSLRDSDGRFYTCLHPFYT